MPGRNTDPKVPISTGVSADLFVAAEDYANANGFVRGEKANLSGLLMVALAEKIGFTLPVEEKATAQRISDEERKRMQREAEARRREEARAKVAALRAKSQGGAPVAAAATAAKH